MSAYAEINQKLLSGGVVLLPTETVFGLACHAENARAVEKIYALKGRSFQKPLAVCVKNLEAAQRLGEFSDAAKALAKKYWPGSLTIITKAKPNLKIDPNCQSKFGELTTIAFRCPEADWLPHLDGPLALTSANRSGEKETVSYAAAIAELGEEIDSGLKTDMVLSGSPSTIISVIGEEIKILRQGSLEVAL